MFRYVGLIWNSIDPAQNQAARILAARVEDLSADWRCVLQAEGMQVFVAETTVSRSFCHLHGNSGVVLGTLFERCDPITDEPPARMRALDERASSRIVHSSGRALVESYWGRYVAFIRRGLDRKQWLLSGPVSDLPCYVSAIQGITVAYSRLVDCARIAKMTLKPDWEQLAIRVATAQDRVGTSVLRDVSTVYPGECIAFTPSGSSRQFYWHPQEVANQEQIDDLDAAASALRATAMHCISAWAGCYDSVLLMLSGGLDSSTILGCLSASHTSPNVTCLNLRTTDRQSDERFYARLAATRAGRHLVEIDGTRTIDLRDTLRFSPQASAVNTIGQSLVVTPVIRKVATTVNADSVFNGNQGDAIFYNHHFRLAGVDYASRHGIGSSLLRLLSKISTSSRSHFTIWRLLGDALRFGWLGFSWDYREEIVSTQKLISKRASEFARNSSSTLAPWFSGRVTLPPGKFAHAYHLLLPSQFYDPLEMPTDPERTDPLGSQPLVELCLQIPTYVHTHNGRARAAQRRAFQDHIPREIATRQWKGSAGAHYKTALTGGIDFARQLLLDGTLAREQLLDRNLLESSFSSDPSRGPVTTTLELLDYVGIEAWLTTLQSLRSTNDRALEEKRPREMQADPQIAVR